MAVLDSPLGPHINLRCGTPRDIPALNAIAFEAKAHWGYSIEQLRAWLEELSVTADSLVARPVCVAEVDGQPIGFAQVATDTEPWELWALWVHPRHIGSGAGKALLAWARASAAVGGQAELAIDSDPNASGFYEHCGARIVGAVAAPIAGSPARFRPQLRLPTRSLED